VSALSSERWDLLAGTRAELIAEISQALNRLVRLDSERLAAREAARLYAAMDAAIAEVRAVAR